VSAVNTKPQRDWRTAGRRRRASAMGRQPRFVSVARCQQSAWRLPV